MPGQRLYFAQSQHLAFAKNGFKFLVFDTRIATRNQQNFASIAKPKGQRFGNATRLYVMRKRGQCHCRGVDF
jgi:hypothetical protein